MFEFGLRILLLLLCFGGIATSVQVAIWTAKPWFRQILGTNQEVAVTVEPVGFIEGGKLKDGESVPIASQLRHRLAQIAADLSRDLSDRYAVLQKAGVSIPTTRVEGGESFQLWSDNSVSFEVEVFKFDVAGLLGFIGNRLDARDSVKTMVEMGTQGSRVFLDVSRVNGPSQRLIIEAGPTLNEVIDVAACAVIQAYRGRDGLFAGLDAHSFCEFLKALDQFQAFIVQSANTVETGGQMDLQKAQAITARLAAAPFETAESPVIHLILASLHRLQGDMPAAVARLERAAALVPAHEYVAANLKTWREEMITREAQARALADAKRTPLAATRLEATYVAIREQPELTRIKYPQMLERLQTLPIGGEVVIAVFASGFTMPTDPAPRPAILPTKDVDGQDGEDDANGHGNLTTHLLAALTPRQGISILPIKVLSARGVGSTASLLTGLDLAAASGADVLAIPLGLRPVEKGPSAFEAALARLNVIAVAAAGNEPDTVMLPAALPGVIGVGGTVADGAWAQFSPRSSEVDVAAPSADVLTTLTGREVQSMSGTSFGTMIVAALFGLAKSVAPDLDQEAILAALVETAQPGGTDRPRTIDALAFIERIAASRS